MIKIYKHNGTVINFDNAYFAAKFASDNPDAVELTDDEVTEAFGDYAHFAGPNNTTVDDEGNITFDNSEAVILTAKIVLEKGKAELEDSFSATCNAGVSYNEIQYRCQQVDMALMEQVLAVATRTGQETVQVRALDYTWQTLTLEEFSELCNLVASTYLQAYEDYSLALNNLY